MTTQRDLLNRLVSGAVLTEEDGVMGEDVEDTVVREGRENDSTIGIANEVQESRAEGHNAKAPL